MCKENQRTNYGMFFSKTCWHITTITTPFQPSCNGTADGARKEASMTLAEVIGGPVAKSIISVVEVMVSKVGEIWVEFVSKNEIKYTNFGKSW